MNILAGTCNSTAKVSERSQELKPCDNQKQEEPEQQEPEYIFNMSGRAIVTKEQQVEEIYRDIERELKKDKIDVGKIQKHTAKLNRTLAVIEVSKKARLYKQEFRQRMQRVCAEQD